MKPFALCISFAWILFVSLPVQADSNEKRLESGAGHFEFSSTPGTAEKPVTVWYALPAELKPETRVLFVMHGVLRNGEEYRDAWLDLARKHEFVLIVPEFSNKHYRGSPRYHFGNVYHNNGGIYEENDPADWSFSAIDAIFAEVRERTGIEAETYTLYGHSAGAQFVHRLVLFHPEAGFDLAIAANSGSYTMPTLDRSYPYGLDLDNPEGNGINEERLEKALKRRLIVLLGEEDTDENDRYLPRAAGALEQGKHRFERGQNFQKIAKEEAEARGIEFLWELHTVPGVGHSNPRMAPAAVEVLGW